MRQMNLVTSKILYFYSNLDDSSLFTLSIYRVSVDERALTFKLVFDLNDLSRNRDQVFMCANSAALYIANIFPLKMIHFVSLSLKLDSTFRSWSSSYKSFGAVCTRRYSSLFLEFIFICIQLLALLHWAHHLDQYYKYFKLYSNNYGFNSDNEKKILIEKSGSLRWCIRYAFNCMLSGTGTKIDMIMIARLTGTPANLDDILLFTTNQSMTKVLHIYSNAPSCTVSQLKQISTTLQLSNWHFWVICIFDIVEYATEPTEKTTAIVPAPTWCNQFLFQICKEHALVSLNC